MKTAILFTFFLSAGLAFTQDSISNSMPSSRVIPVATAIDHITVIELGEPITLAAAGSSAFKIERHGDKIFIEPLKAGASTDLVVWTNTRRFTYELETTGDVRNMNFAIVSPPPVPAPPVKVDQPDQEQMDQIADMVLTRALLGAEQVNSQKIRMPRDKITLRIQQVFQTRNTTYIHFLIVNRSKSSYEVPEPSVARLEVNDSDSLENFKNQQLTSETIQSLGTITPKPISVVHSETTVKDVRPGEETQGVLAIRESIEPPTAIQLKFGSQDRSTLTATVVF